MASKKISTKQKLSLSALLVLGAVSLPVIASEFSAPYVGGDLGIGRTRLSGNLDTPNKSAALYGLEGGYNWDLADSGWLFGTDVFYAKNKNKVRPVSLNGVPQGDANLGVNMYGLDAKLGYPMSSWLPYAKLGYGHLKATGDVSGSENGPRLGLGLERKLTDNWSLGAEYDHMRSKSDNGSKIKNNGLFLTLKYYFDNVAKAAPVAAIAAAAAPAPEPAPAVETPAPPPPAKVCAENLTLPGALFAYDKAALKDAKVAALDAFGEKLKAGTYSAVTVTGYTDRLGSDAYNERLSQNRAETIKAYLAKFVSADMITAQGRGKADPVTKDCKGDKKSKALVACLAPDRRVEIAATGACK